MKIIFLLFFLSVSFCLFSQEDFKVSPIVWQFEKDDYSGYIVLSSEMIKEEELFSVDVFKDSLDWDIDYLLLNAIKDEYLQTKMGNILMMQEFNFIEYYSEEQLEIVIDVMKSFNTFLDEKIILQQIQNYPPILLRGIMEIHQYGIGNQHTFMALESIARSKGIVTVPYIGYKWEMENITQKPEKQIEYLFEVYNQRNEIKELVKIERANYFSGQIENWSIKSLSKEEVEDIKAAAILMSDYIKKGVVMVQAGPNYLFHEEGFYNWFIKNGFRLTRIKFDSSK